MAITTVFVISDNAAALPELCSGAKAMGAQVTAVVFGGKAEAEAAAPHGADRLVYCPLGEADSPEDYTAALAALVKKEPAAAVFVSNTIRGRCIAGRLGVLLDTAVFTNASDPALADGVLTCSRTVYGGAAQRKVQVTTPYAVLTLNGGSFAVDEALPAPAVIEPIEGAPESRIRRVALQEKQEGGVNLAVAKCIVDVGRGLAKEEDLAMIRQLARALGAEVGCSRPVAENNRWLPKDNYMGITGVQVKPDVIVVVGVSGQIQHIGGINKSKLIVAINKDKNAPIFKNCDLGLVGDLYKIVPALIAKLS